MLTSRIGMVVSFCFNIVRSIMTKQSINPSKKSDKVIYNEFFVEDKFVILHQTGIQLPKNTVLRVAAHKTGNEDYSGYRDNVWFPISDHRIC